MWVGNFPPTVILYSENNELKPQLSYFLQQLEYKKVIYYAEYSKYFLYCSELFRKQ